MKLTPIGSLFLAEAFSGLGGLPGVVATPKRWIHKERTQQGSWTDYLCIEETSN